MRGDRLRLAAAALATVLGTVALVAGGVLTVAAQGAEPGLSAPESSTAASTAATGTVSAPSPTTSATADPTDTATPTGTPSTSGSPIPSEDPSSSLTVDDAVLRWGVNNESNNRAYAPDTFNFFSAGRVPDPGRGGTTLTRSHWRATRGAVEISKWDGSSWRRATWAGLRTDSAGRPLGAPTAGTFSNHTLVFTQGAGTVDPDAGTATVAWHGAATVLYYSGMSFFYLSDPVLRVADGRGRLTATISGFASSIDDPDSWSPVPPSTVVMADLPEVELTRQGLTAEPAYRGVRVSGTAQDTTGSSWGSFPASFVRVMERLGTGAFWYSSGAATDAFKVPLPVGVAWSGGATGATPQPGSATSQPPITQPTPTPPREDTTPRSDSELLPPLLPPSTESAAAGELLLLARPTTQPRALPATEQVSTATGLSRAAAGWWLGGALLLIAAALLLIPPRVTPRLGANTRS